MGQIDDFNRSSSCYLLFELLDKFLTRAGIFLKIDVLKNLFTEQLKFHSKIEVSTIIKFQEKLDSVEKVIGTLFKSHELLLKTHIELANDFLNEIYNKYPFASNSSLYNIILGLRVLIEIISPSFCDYIPVIRLKQIIENNIRILEHDDIYIVDLCCEMLKNILNRNKNSKIFDIYANEIIISLSSAIKKNYDEYTQGLMKKP